ncbi:MAG: class I SAM-dependent methyltransferase [Alphaproteobacteria bacterium]|jgi:predicted O-methyltransferase YrrM|nr:SAM-dependent methyltransferase [Rhodospirillaceae bacterium]MDG2482919.1 class I SAM-dependent methyltransferase [Alphaproteobacteria bacterium]MBT6205184.1 SAM-dependent methyltransferase [Rhodospirillaceae bacterium]MBT6509488.1 SAM-dependent methyltransferase [Rhodospirillaceae bacterium]MBT7614949.1 SAM-dependent methyltransferase [Rhodospirillaceae bacterium]
MKRKTIGLSDDLFDYVIATTHRDDEVLRDLRVETAGLAAGRMQIAPDQGQFMAMLASLIGATWAIEVGVFTGYSGLSVARALGNDGHLLACDVSEEWTAIARRHWQTAGVDDRIDLRLAPAVETLDNLIAEGQSGTYDMAFIDADKANYDAYYERCLALVRSGGLVLVDNVLWGGSVIEPDDDSDDTTAIRALNVKMGVDERIDMVMLPVGDGLSIARKR